MAKKNINWKCQKCLLLYLFPNRSIYLQFIYSTQDTWKAVLPNSYDHNFLHQIYSFQHICTLFDTKKHDFHTQMVLPLITNMGLSIFSLSHYLHLKFYILWFSTKFEKYLCKVYTHTTKVTLLFKIMYFQFFIGIYS